jgi:hypothetical protein
MKENQKKIEHGLKEEACRQVGVSSAIYRKAKKVQRDGGELSRKQLEVLVTYKRLVAEAHEKLKSLEDQP